MRVVAGRSNGRRKKHIYTPGMIIAAVAAVIWFNTVRTGILWMLVVAAAGSWVIDLALGYRGKYEPVEPAEKFYSKEKRKAGEPPL